MTKPSHYSTPRQMRDCQWASGSVSYSRQPWRFSDLAVAAIAVAVCVLIVMGAI
jgi:hypothetical protein